MSNGKEAYAIRRVYKPGVPGLRRHLRGKPGVGKLRGIWRTSLHGPLLGMLLSPNRPLSIPSYDPPGKEEKRWEIKCKDTWILSKRLFKA